MHDSEMVSRFFDSLKTRLNGYNSISCFYNSQLGWPLGAILGSAFYFVLRKQTMSDYATNKQEWWEIVDKNWENLKSLVKTFHSSNKSIPDLEITNERAEALRKELTQNKKAKSMPDLEKLKKEQDIKMLDVFNDTYWNIPESTSCWRYPGFGILCDLCSEGYVLNEE